jgi:nitroreductase/NAD-dependent dihydropyrimidine dehydrogenase PreA subunit
MITINESKCTTCGICEKNCPTSIITISAPSTFPSIDKRHEKRCVHCGHCEAICPTGALTLELPETYTEPNENGKSALNSAEIGTYFRSRRSIRNYKKKEVSKETIEKVMDIVRYAPTGMNTQSIKWLIVHDTKLVERLSELTIDFMRLVAEKDAEKAKQYGFIGYLKMIENGVTASQIVSRNAPHLAIAYIDANNPIGINDSIIATAHLELVLPAFDLGGCWAGYMNMAFQLMDEMKQILGIEPQFIVRSVLLFGYPQYSYQKVPARKKADVIWV